MIIRFVGAALCAGLLAFSLYVALTDAPWEATSAAVVVETPTIHERRVARCERLWEQFASAATNGIARAVRQELQRNDCPQKDVPSPSSDTRDNCPQEDGLRFYQPPKVGLGARC